MTRCLDEGTILCIVDGELAEPDRRGTVSHLATCGPCARAVLDARLGAALTSYLLGPRLFPAPPADEGACEKIVVAARGRGDRGEGVLR